MDCAGSDIRYREDVAVGGDLDVRLFLSLLGEYLDPIIEVVAILRVVARVFPVEVNGAGAGILRTILCSQVGGIDGEPVLSGGASRTRQAKPDRKGKRCTKIERPMFHRGAAGGPLSP